LAGGDETSHRTGRNPLRRMIGRRCCFAPSSTSSNSRRWVACENPDPSCRPRRAGTGVSHADPSTCLQNLPGIEPMYVRASDRDISASSRYPAKSSARTCDWSPWQPTGRGRSCPRRDGPTRQRIGRLELVDRCCTARYRRVAP
jgi:hypothetical protein